jgi:tRNA(fMet)-specific endonuclease VapC
MYVLDTNTVIHFFKAHGKVVERMLATPSTEIAVPTIVVFELEVGIAKSAQPNKRRQQLEELLKVVTVLPFDRLSASTAAQIRAGLEKIGQPIGPFDTLIAGTALAYRATLVTRNTREFERVPGLSIVNWYD